MTWKRWWRWCTMQVQHGSGQISERFAVIGHVNTECRGEGVDEYSRHAQQRAGRLHSDTESLHTKEHWRHRQMCVVFFLCRNCDDIFRFSRVLRWQNVCEIWCLSFIPHFKSVYSFIRNNDLTLMEQRWASCISVNISASGVQIWYCLL